MVLNKETMELIEGILSLSEDKLKIYFASLDPEALAYVDLILAKYEKQELS